MKAVIHPKVVPAHTIEDDALVFARPISPVFARLREPVEAQAGALVSVMRALSGRELPVLRVAFPLPRPDDAERHAPLLRLPGDMGGAAARGRVPGIGARAGAAA